MKIGEKIALCRKQAGLSQEELANSLNVSRQAVSRWETEAATPETEKVIQLSRMFGVSTDYLLLDERERLEESRKASIPPESETQNNALTERRRHFRIAFGVTLAILGLATAIAALFLTQAHAESLTEWWTELGRFGTALRSWRGGMLAFGIFLILGGAACLVREYIRRD